MKTDYRYSFVRCFGVSGLYTGLLLVLSLPAQAGPDFSEWGEPEATVGETRPSLSWDLKRLYYGAAGTVYVSERKPGK